MCPRTRNHGDTCEAAAFVEIQAELPQRGLVFLTDSGGLCGFIKMELNEPTATFSRIYLRLASSCGRLNVPDSERLLSWFIFLFFLTVKIKPSSLTTGNRTVSVTDPITP